MPSIFVESADEKKHGIKAMGFIDDIDMELDNESTYGGSDFKLTPAITQTPRQVLSMPQQKLEEGYNLRSGQTDSRFSATKERQDTRN